MNKIFYMQMNKKNYFALILTLISPLLVNNIYLLLINLVLIIVLFDGPLNKDLFIYKDNQLYLLLGNNKYLYRIALLILLFLVLTLCISRYYLSSIILFYLILLLIFVNNINISRVNKTIVKDLDIDKYRDKLLVVCGVQDYKLKVTNVACENYLLDYRLNKSFINYNSLKKLIESL